MVCRQQSVWCQRGLRGTCGGIGGGPGSCRAAAGAASSTEPAAAAVSGSARRSDMKRGTALTGAAGRPLKGSGTLKRLHSSGSGRHSCTLRCGRFGAACTHQIEISKGLLQACKFLQHLSHHRSGTGYQRGCSGAPAKRAVAKT